MKSKKILVLVLAVLALGLLLIIGTGCSDGYCESGTYSVYDDDAGVSNCENVTIRVERLGSDYTAYAIIKNNKETVKTCYTCYLNKESSDSAWVLEPVTGNRSATIQKGGSAKIRFASISGYDYNGPFSVSVRINKANYQANSTTLGDFSCRYDKNSEITS